MPLMRDRSVVRLSVTPSAKYSNSGSPPMFAKGRTTVESRGGPDFSSVASFGGVESDAVEAAGTAGHQSASSHSTRKARIGRSMFLSINSPRVMRFTLSRPCTASCIAREMTVPPGGASDCRRAAMFTPSIVALDYQVSQMQTNAEDDLLGLRLLSIEVGYGLLNLNRRRQCINCACEFNQRAIAHKLDQPAAKSRKCRLYAFLTVLPQSRQCAALVAPHQAGVADNVGSQDRRQFALLTGHGNSPACLRRIVKGWQLAGNPSRVLVSRLTDVC